MTNDTRSPDEIERDLQRRRERVDSTIEELQDRLSPGQLMDQALGYVRGSGSDFGGEFGRNLSRTVRKNPVPVTLVGAGLAWLAAASLSSGANSARRADWDADEDDGLAGRYRDVRAGDLGGPDSTLHAGELYPESAEEAEIASRDEGIAKKLEMLRASVSQKSDETSEAFQDRLYQARASSFDLKQRADESAADFRSRVDQQMRDLGGRMQERRRRAGARMAATRADVAARARRGAAWTGDAARGARNDVVRRGRATGQAAADLFNEQPLLVGLLGCTVGAGLAAMLPVSQREHEVFGPHRDRMLAEGESAARDAMSRAERVGARTAGAADEHARREGLTRDAAREAGEDLAGRVSRVAESTVEAARDEGRKQTEDASRRGSIGSA